MNLRRELIALFDDTLPEPYRSALAPSFSAEMADRVLELIPKAKLRERELIEEMRGCLIEATNHYSAECASINTPREFRAQDAIAKATEALGDGQSDTPHVRTPMSGFAAPGGTDGAAKVIKLGPIEYVPPDPLADLALSARRIADCLEHPARAATLAPMRPKPGGGWLTTLHFATLTDRDAFESEMQQHGQAAVDIDGKHVPLTHLEFLK